MASNDQSNSELNANDKKETGINDAGNYDANAENINGYGGKVYQIKPHYYGCNAQSHGPSFYRFHRPRATQMFATSNLVHIIPMNNETETETNTASEGFVGDTQLNEEFESTSNEIAPQFNSSARTVYQPNSADTNDSDAHEGRSEMNTNRTKRGY